MKKVTQEDKFQEWVTVEDGLESNEEVEDNSQKL